MQQSILDIIQIQANSTSQQRGKEIYKRGNVRNLTFDLDENFYSAKVKGSSLYTVIIFLDKDDVPNDFKCSCPYDW